MQIVGLPLSFQNSKHLLGILFGLVFASLLSSSAQGAQETIRGFELNHCSGKNCISLRTEKSLRSNLDSIFVFARANLTTFIRNEDGVVIQREFTGKDGYYDAENARIFLRGLSDSEQEITLNLKTGIINYY